MREKQPPNILENMVNAYDLRQFRGSYRKAGQYYFKQIRRLDVDILQTEIEIVREQKQLNAVVEKLKQFKGENKTLEIDARKIAENVNEPIHKQYVCPNKQCGHKFMKQSTLKYHRMIVHNLPSPNWREKQVFQITIKQQAQDSSQ